MLKSLSSAVLAAAALAGINVTMPGEPSNTKATNLNPNSNTQLNKKAPNIPRPIDLGLAKFLRRMSGAGVGTSRQSYPNGPGWPQAQVKRMARKKRDQARNRRTHRG